MGAGDDWEFAEGFAAAPRARPAARIGGAGTTLRQLPLLLACALVAVVSPAGAQDGAKGLEIRWLGVAGFSITDGDGVLLHDPFLSRPGIFDTLFGVYQPDPLVLAQLLAPTGPAPECVGASAILIGHSHYDHMGDAPWIAQRTNARIVGSRSTVAIAQGYGVKRARTRETSAGDVFDLGSFSIRVVASEHARIFFGRPPLTGEVLEPPDGPIHAFSFKLGDARGYLVTHVPSGLRIYVISSAGVDRAALEALHAEGIEVDVLLAATEGRDAEYTADLVGLLRPRLVIPHHFDDFFTPVSAPGAASPTKPDDLAAFRSEVLDASERFGTGTRYLQLDLFEATTIRRD